MALAHNGNLSNAVELRSELELTGAIFHTTSDTETIAYIITKERLQAPSIEEAVSRAMNTLDGAYSLVLMSLNGLAVVSICSSGCAVTCMRNRHRTFWHTG